MQTMPITHILNLLIIHIMSLLNKLIRTTSSVSSGTSNKKINSFVFEFESSLLKLELVRIKSKLYNTLLKHKQVALKTSMAIELSLQ